MKSEVQFLKEYGNQINKYATKYGIHLDNLAKKINAKPDTLNKVLAGQATFSFKTMLRLSNLFGLAHYEFSNPDFQCPQLEKLPEETQIWINSQKEIVPQKNTDTLAIALDELIRNGKLKYPTTSKILFWMMKSSIREGRESIEVTTLLKYRVENGDIRDIGYKYGNQNIFIHKSSLNKYKKKEKSEVYSIIDKQEDALGIPRKKQRNPDS